MVVSVEVAWSEALPEAADGNGQRPGTMKNAVTTTSASATAIPVWVGCIGLNYTELDYTMWLEKP